MTRPTSPVSPIPGLMWFYVLWICLATLSAVLGHSEISRGGSLFLLGGIASTNFFFASIMRSEPRSTGLKQLLSMYQTIMAIAWTSAYFYFSHGAGDLVLGMYMTALMFSMFHLNTKKVLKLGAAALLGYLFVVLAKMLSTGTFIMSLADGIRFLVLIAVIGWAYMFARQLRDLRYSLQYRNEELQTVVERVTRISEVDHLTKSFNRRHIMEVLARERSRADRSGSIFSILLFDLDHFKRINDRYGHLIGDQILSDFANRVKGELRGMDMVNATEHKRSFGRYGGEEFIAVLPGTALTGAKRCADRIRKIIADQQFRDRYSVTVSVGVAEYQLGETVPQLLTRADEALYKAKRDGRNCVRESQREDHKDSGTVPNLRILRKD
ncbi:MAG: GGDEF domain-containing protein [Gammaproteobacteria bacterium]|nr:GGDEF domain-containing protein [Gammaproteobacteria bacterium]MDP7041593.1 GGDEF domain-containing protein [Gammaproteobacteria bacterium]